MQLSAWLGNLIESGKITLISGDKEALQINAENKRFDLNALDKEFLKEVLRSGSGDTSIRSMLVQLRTLAAELKEEGITVTLSFDGDRLLTIGVGAKPKFSQLLTKTNAAEINNLRRLLQFIV